MDKEPGAQKMLFRVRFEYGVSAQPFRLFKRYKDLKQEAAASRRKKVNILQQVYIKGVHILEIDPNYSVYLKEEGGRKIAYAPVEVTFKAESLEDAIPFLLAKDFCNVELMHPEKITFNPQEFEQVVEKMNKELQSYKSCLEIRYGSKGDSYILKDLTRAEVPGPGEEDGSSENILDDNDVTEGCEPLMNSSTKRVLRLEWDLEIIVTLSLLLAGVILLGGKGWLHYLQVGLGLPFVLFFPGYVLIAALFPKKDDLDGIERVALSFGLSIAVVPLIGLALNYTSWGIRLTPILLSLVVFILGMGSVSFFRREKLPENDRYCPTFEFEVPVWQRLPLFDRVLSIALIAAILFAVGSICYVVAMPKVGEKFTEFYILGMDGKAEGYPRELEVEENGEVIVGVVNHEYQQEKYYVEIKMDDLALLREGPIILEHEKKWENTMSFSYPDTYDNLKVEFLLYREGDEKPYRSLHLWVNIH